MLNNEILKKLKSSVGNHSIRLPSGIAFHLEGAHLTMELSLSAVGLGKNPLNMQANEAAFEGWALALYVHLHLNAENGTVTLQAPISKRDDSNFEDGCGHYNRFLYRVMKFSKQFAWFHLSEALAEEAARFQQFLESGKFVNNLGNESAGENGKSENSVEAAFTDSQSELLRQIAKQKGCSLGENPIFRQLPVGLFKEQVSNESKIFTGGSSAIDLWTESEGTISIFELKALNKMIGIITELLFYANYMYDMYCANTSFAPAPPKNDVQDRGYASLVGPCGEKIHTKVQAFFLCDVWHPLLTAEVIRLMNREGISFDLLSYEFSIVLKP